MPLYTYRCNECDHVFEARQRMSEDPLTACPTCPGDVRRVINSVGVVFKGNGFYVTDTRKNGNGRVKPSTDSATDSAPPTDTKDKKEKSVSKPVPETKTAVSQPAAM